MAFLAMLLFVCANSASAQVSFSHSLGAELLFGGEVGSPAIMYSPRLNLLNLNDAASLSVGTHLGVWLAFNSREGGAAAFDLPIVAEINFGTGSTPDADASFGGFAGLGLGFNTMGSNAAFGAVTNNAFGPVVNGGVRLFLGEMPVGARVSYLLNVKEGGASVLGLGAFYTFR